MLLCCVYLYIRPETFGTTLVQPHCSYVNRANFSQSSRGFVSDSWAFLFLLRPQITFNYITFYIIHRKSISANDFDQIQEKNCGVKIHTHFHDVGYSSFPHNYEIISYKPNSIPTTQSSANIQ